MKIRNLIIGAIAAVAGFAACQEKEADLGTPDISISPMEMSFEAAGGEQTLTINATRDWKVETDVDWVVISPESGEGSAEDQTVSVTALENTGMDRSADLKVTIGMRSKDLSVFQAGPGGSAEALIVYSNNFDKEPSVKDGNYWPYPDQTDCWQNQTGTGSSNVGFGAKNMTVRNNLNSDTYANASGVNNLLFGKAGNYFMISEIAMPSSQDFTLSFGTIRNLYEAVDNTFVNSEFHVWLSNDGNKWVEIEYAFEGGPKNDTWDLATSNFSLSSAVSKLYIAFTSDLASGHRLDDLSLVIASEKGTVVDFASGVEKDFAADSGNTGGGNTTAPESKGKKTVAEFITAADTQNYYELTGTVSGFNSTYCSFDLTDATGKIYVYSLLDASKSEWSSKISNGGTVTLYGKYLFYEKSSKHEVVDAHIVSFTSGTVETPTDITTVTVAEFLEKPVDNTWYRLSGTVGGSINTTFGNFDLIDDTGRVYVYGIENWSSYSSNFAEGDKVTIVGHRYIYTDKEGKTKDEVIDAYIESWTAGEGNTGGETPAPPAGETGEYDPQGVTWTLGANSYDNTLTGNNCQTATVNNVKVNNLLKLGTGSKVGNATLHVAAETKKIGFYAVAWKGKTVQVKFSTGGKDIVTLEPSANTGASGNAPYTITLSSSDYYEVELPSGTKDVYVETLDPANGRVLLIGLKAITE